MRRLILLLAFFLLAVSISGMAQNSSVPVKEYNDPEAPPPAAPAPQATHAAPPPSPQQPPGVQEYNDTEQPAAPAPAPQQVAPGSTLPASPAAAAGAPAAAPAPAPAAPAASPRDEEMRQIAERFAPVIHQRMAGSDADHRFELPTNFDFDGDWIGNNNWVHAADTRYPIWSFVYYDALETEDYYFLHYSLYHARDWSTVQGDYDSVLDRIQDQYKQILTPQARQEAEFNHENDLEGILVVVDKWGENGPQVVAIETVAHNHLLRAVAPGSELHDNSGRALPLALEDGRPVIYVESQKHGIHPYNGERSENGEPIVVLRYGKSRDLGSIRGDTATYDLINQVKTFWVRARETHEPNLTFGTVMDFGDTFCRVPGATRPACVMGTVGAALRGDVARPNAANAPWAWFDADDPQLPAGAWVFDPMVILRRHYGVSAEQTYSYNPYLGIDAALPAGAK